MRFACRHWIRRAGLPFLLFCWPAALVSKKEESMKHKLLILVLVITSMSYPQRGYCHNLR